MVYQRYYETNYTMLVLAGLLVGYVQAWVPVVPVVMGFVEYQDDRRAQLRRHQYLCSLV